MSDLFFYNDSKVVTDSLTVAIKLLDKAAKDSFKEPFNLSKNLAVVDKAEKILISKGVAFLTHSVRSTIVKNFLDSQPTEKEIYKWFIENYKEKLGAEFSLITRRNDSKHIPDFWLDSPFGDIPVEVKLNSFDHRALKQLERYMEYYKTNLGIAVGRDCKCELPRNIYFVSYKD